MNMKYQVERCDVLDNFSSNFHDLHYNVAQDPATNDAFYLYNPESILRIGLISPEEKIEGLFIRQRFEDALRLSNNSYNKPMLPKIQSAHFNYLLNTNQIE